MAIMELPGEGTLPPGPRRELVEELHTLYGLAKYPSLRRISAEVRANEAYAEMVSYETVRSMFKGLALPRWPKLEAVVRVLSDTAVTRPDPDLVVEAFHGLWARAHGHTSPVEPPRPSAAEASEDGGSGPAPSARRHTAALASARLEGSRVDLRFEEASEQRFVRVETVPGRAVVTLNLNHALVEAFMVRDAQGRGDRRDLVLVEHRAMRRAFELLVFAWGRAVAEARTPEARIALENVQQDWGRLASTLHRLELDEFDWSDPSTWRWMPPPRGGHR
ncbi:hypothetical protein ACFU8I_39855 [Streptomyces sp. NPDC057540]|uniref:hypothetical protein n=1 Tax=Streptomyces sp. NPDC057540 TaxID=3346160 RepID=UPI00368F69C7